MRIQQSVCYPIFKTQLSLDELFRQCAAVGYRAVELWSRGDDFEEVVATAKRHRLVVASMCGHNSLPDGLNKRSNHDRIEAELVESIDIAARHGIPGVICFSGNRQPHMGELEAIEAVADGLKRVAPYAERKGVNLNMELLNSKVNHPGYQCDHTAWGAAVCEKVASPRVKLLFDIYHMQIMEGDLSSAPSATTSAGSVTFTPRATRAGRTWTTCRSSTMRASVAPSPRRATTSTWGTSSSPRATPSRGCARHSLCATRGRREIGRGPEEMLAGQAASISATLPSHPGAERGGTRLRCRRSSARDAFPRPRRG
jgi:hydroxypyruvate isomerase